MPRTNWADDYVRNFPDRGLRRLLDSPGDLGLALHLDGARLMNAAVACGVDAATLACGFDTVTLCLSMGLGAPMGALLATSQARLEEAMRAKHLMGGAMRQSGIVAAAGLYALRHNVERLAEDHANARALAGGLSRIPGVKVERVDPPTNMVFFSLDGASVAPQRFVARMLEEGVRFSSAQPNRFRAVTHLDVTRDDVEEAVQKVERVLSRGLGWRNEETSD